MCLIFCRRYHIDQYNLDYKHLFEPRAVIHNEIRKSYSFESNRTMYRRPTIDYTLFEDILHEQNVHKSDKNFSQKSLHQSNNKKSLETDLLLNRKSFVNASLKNKNFLNHNKLFRKFM